ncbi:Bug family tripartite tricarboxylate transporter substrate binding protein [Pararhizobium haloflavum]|uniref:Bug family tripartite tricarboxylate transporter substrate binding protein n=1 Tax=Pararhizobium haloflavum TaxID=2037914 RepID=UPI000C1864AB|nr:tripartite tricarboxylate transporter substrate binding protein [Pararhizobium haloflavum]
MMISKCRFAGLVATAALVAGGAFAQEAQMETPQGFGKRPLTMIVPFGAGGGSDQLARAMAQSMNEVAGLNFQIVTRPGGGGVAAIPDFMLAPADGHTILQHIDLIVAAYAKGDIQENPAEDWAPLCTTQITFNQLYIAGDEDRFSDWESMVAYMEESGEQLTVANLGQVGSMEQITMDMMEDAVGLEFRKVAYDNPSERYGSLIGGHADVLFEQPGDVRNFIESGQMKPIVTFYEERPEVFADVPTHRDLGADFDAMLRFRGFYVKGGTPQDRVDFLVEACERGFNTESYQAFNADNYMDLIDSFRDQEGTRQLINDTVATYQAIYEEMGILE